MSKQSPLFSFYRGDDYALKIQVKDSLNNPVNVSGWQLTFTAKSNPNKDDTFSSIQVQSGTLAGVDAESGIAYLLLPNAKTKLMKPGEYFFDVQSKFGTAITTVLAGIVEVLPDVTWGA